MVLKHWVRGAALAAACLTLPALAQEAPPAEGIVAALRAAVTQHPGVKSGLSGIAAAGHGMDAARAARLPTVSVSRQTSTGDSNAAPGGVIAVQQPLWAGGRIDAGIELAGRRQATSEATLLETRRALIENTAAAYAILQGARERLRMAEQNVDEHRKLQEMIARRMRGGVASAADLGLASSRLAQAVAQREQVAGETDKAANDLFALTLARVDAAAPIPDAMLALPTDAELTALAQDASASVLRRSADAQVVRGEGELAKAQLMPTLSLRVERDMGASGSNAANYSPQRAALVFQASVEGAGFAGAGRVKAEAERYNGALEDIETARNDALRRVRGLLADRASGAQVQRAQEQVAATSEETMASFLRQYDAGRKSWVDVLNTQREMADARQSLERTRTALRETTLRLGAFAGLFDRFAGIKP